MVVLGTFGVIPTTRPEVKVTSFDLMGRNVKEFIPELELKRVKTRIVLSLPGCSACTLMKAELDREQVSYLEVKPCRLGGSPCLPSIDEKFVFPTLIDVDRNGTVISVEPGYRPGFLADKGEKQ